MANVHGFGGGNNRPNQNRGNQGYQNVNPVSDEIPFMNTMKGDERPPMQETIPYTLKIICCPDFKFFSTTVFLLLAIWILYIICLTRGISTKDNDVLQVQTTVLLDFGAAQGIKIKQGQIYRLITAAFLHVDLLHILMNSISMLIFITRFEKIFPIHTPIVMLVSSISGFMLSVLCNRTHITVGASAAIFGILGGFIAYLIINWVALQRYGPIRGTLACIIGILVVFSILFSIGSSIDILAHIGGLISGIFISMAILPGLEQKNRTMTLIGYGGIAVMNLITFLLFFLLDS